MENLLPRVQSVLAITPGRWLRLTENLPDDLLTRPAAEGEWSAVDCLRHLLDTEMHIFPARVKAFLAGEDFESFDPDTEGASFAGQEPIELASAFAQLRAESMALLSQLRPEDLELTANHSELGPTRLWQLLNEWAAHDLMHTVQAERAIMQPFIQGTGPWRKYFTDHDLGDAL